MKTEEIVSVSELSVGQSVSKESIQQAAERLMATGKFERVDYRWKTEEAGIVVTFTVREMPVIQADPEPPAVGPRVKEVVFAGNKVISTQRLSAALKGVVEDRVYEKDDFQQAIENLLRPVYLEQAYWAVKFTPATEPVEGGVRVRVAVDEGAALTLASVDIEGGDAKWLTSAGFPIGVPAAIRAIQTGVGRVRNNMERDGFIKAGIVMREVQDGPQLRITLKVETGPKFTFDALLIEGMDDASEQRARKLWALKSGDPMDPAAVEAFVKEVFTKRIWRGTGATRQLQIAPGTTRVNVLIQFK